MEATVLNYSICHFINTKPCRSHESYRSVPDEKRWGIYSRYPRPSTKSSSKPYHVNEDSWHLKATHMGE